MGIVSVFQDEKTSRWMVVQQCKRRFYTTELYTENSGGGIPWFPVQLLDSALAAEDAALIPSRGTKILQATRSKEKD